MVPMTLSVANVALRGSDSSQRSRILVAGAVSSSKNCGKSWPRAAATMEAQELTFTSCLFSLLLYTSLKKILVGI